MKERKRVPFFIKHCAILLRWLGWCRLIDILCVDKCWASEQIMKMFENEQTVK